MRGFEPAARLLRQHIRAASESRGFAVSQVLTRWAEIAGPQLAEMAHPVKVTYAAKGMGATLVLLARGSHAPLVEMMKERLRQQVNACYGYNAVARVQITQTSGTGFAEAQAPFRPPAPNARQTGVAESLRATAAGITAGVRDPDLRGQLEQMGRSILSRSLARTQARE